MDEVTVVDVWRTRIKVGRGVINELPDVVMDMSPDKVAVITDQGVIEGLGSIIEGALSAIKAPTEIFIAPRGEQAKSLDTVLRIVELMASEGFTRGSVVVGVGGGAILDLAGFISSIYMRGVGLVYVPTTTLAQADACVGGKTGVNLKGKNVVGAFYHPNAVIVDVSLLSRLPFDVYIEGFSEVVKHGVIAGDPYFSLIESRLDAILSRDERVLEEIIGWSVGLKASIVTKDPRDRGLRAVLNLGHTIGHAIEAYTGYKISHGKAVSIGLVAELALAKNLLGFPDVDLERVKRVLTSLGLPTKPTIPLAEAARYIVYDKKLVGGRIRMPLPRRLGDVALVEVSRGELEAWLGRLGI